MTVQLPDLVVHFIPKLSGGGAEEVALRIAEHQAQHGECIVAYLDGEALELQSSVRFIKVHGSSAGLLRHFHIVSSLRKLLKQSSHSHQPALICHLTYANVLGYLATRFSRIAMLGVHHSASLPSWGWAGRLILGLSYRGSTIVAVSEAVKSFLKQKLALRNCVVLPNPLHLPKLRLTQSVTTTCVKVVAVGRISEVKNYPFMLEVISQLPSQYHLEIIGPGEYGTLELAAEKLGISQRVIFSGPLSKHDLYSRLAAADVYLMTSQFEGEPSSLLEAAALGLPIVGLRNPGLAEALRKVGGLSSMEQEGPVAVAHNIERASKSSTKPADRGWIFQHDPDNAAHKYCELLGFPYCD